MFGRKEPTAEPKITFDPDERMTHDEFADDCDINIIMKRFGVTGEIPANMIKNGGLYGDFTQAGDLRETIERVELAQEQFDNLPAHIRQACENDPVRLLELTSTDEGIRELEELGMSFLEAPEGSQKIPQEPLPDPPKTDTSEGPSEPPSTVST